MKKEAYKEMRRAYGHKRFTSKERLHHYLVGLGMLGALCLAFAASYGATAFLYRYTGRPPELWTHILSGVLGMVLLFWLAGIFQRIFRRGREGRFQDYMGQMGEALQQISQGNFDVFLEPERSGMHHELADAINKMARDLGALEGMRQDFISNVSHEIQSPLTSIGGFASLIQKGDLSEDQRQRYAAIIEAESKRLSSLSENLLKLSSLDNSTLELDRHVFRLDKQLERVALTLEPQWSAKRLQLEADLARVEYCGDADLLSQVWINLLNNAIKFTPEGGRITLALSPTEEGALVTISDTGVGIAQADQMHIFERFYKVDKARDRSLGGNGLGLSLVKRIVELHGSRVTVRSAPGQGAEFKVLLLP